MDTLYHINAILATPFLKKKLIFFTFSPFFPGKTGFFPVDSGSSHDKPTEIIMINELFQTAAGSLLVLCG